jgi:predicted HTH transcriptional regulator
VTNRCDIDRISITAVRESVARLSIERAQTKNRGQVALAERQMRIVENINRTGRITISEVARMFKISRQAALKEIGKMIEMGIIKREGSGRSSFYRMQ